ncbi:RAB, putative [Entamoeba dispar SAW760]|uniref:RAB, putative n=1 Tax=Entamoeba dispar (strain ATCC PRA-260 / SAW760) TaxID=370354 RepID=B0EGQ3_ENTDS|nr:RAB, putative [Entamoeba dispar SAW760]EDR26293.1 RAB, putative [Entamoeba dispar SAW760]|eukprot:EDR26293.1 RAB, putative [Entamoeba dispar SAW760]
MTEEAAKMCLVGDTSVGKTCIVNRLVKGVFNNSEKSTIGSNFVTASIQVDNKPFRLAIWDTAGQEKYRSMVSMYYRGSLGAMLVYDVTQESSFQDVRMWLDELKNTEKDIAVIIVGNKCDLVANRVVSTVDGEKLAEELHCLFCEVSALDGTNITHAFTELAKHMKLPEEGPQYGLTPNQLNKQNNNNCC